MTFQKIKIFLVGVELCLYVRALLVNMWWNAECSTWQQRVKPVKHLQGKMVLRKFVLITVSLQMGCSTKVYICARTLLVPLNMPFTSVLLEPEASL